MRDFMNDLKQEQLRTQRQMNYSKSKTSHELKELLKINNNMA